MYWYHQIYPQIIRVRVLVINSKCLRFFLCTQKFYSTYFFLYYISNYNKIQMVRVGSQPRQPLASPPRPSFLPISEPIPVPTQRDAYERISGHFPKNSSGGGGSNNEATAASPCEVNEKKIFYKSLKLC